MIIKRLFSSSSLSAIRVVSSAYLCFVAQSCLTICNPMDCSPPGSSVHGDSPGKNTGVGCHVLLHGIFPTQGLNPGLPLCMQILCHLSHQGSPCISEIIDISPGMSLLVRVWQSMVHWRREWQSTLVFLHWEPHEKYKRSRIICLKLLPMATGWIASEVQIFLLTVYNTNFKSAMNVVCLFLFVCLFWLWF